MVSVSKMVSTLFTITTNYFLSFMIFLVVCVYYKILFLLVYPYIVNSCIFISPNHILVMFKKTLSLYVRFVL